MDKVMALFRKKYPDVNDFMAIRSMAYFDDAELTPMPKMIDASVTWEKMKSHILNNLNTIL